MTTQAFTGRLGPLDSGKNGQKREDGKCRITLWLRIWAPDLAWAGILTSAQISSGICSLLMDFSLPFAL